MCGAKVEIIYSAASVSKPRPHGQLALADRFDQLGRVALDRFRAADNSLADADQLGGFVARTPFRLWLFCHGRIPSRRPSAD